MNKLSILAAIDNTADIVPRIGIVLDKNVFALHGTHGAGKVVLVRPKVRCDRLLDVRTQLPSCIIGMEACSGAHYWARVLIELPPPKLMEPKFVSPLSDSRQAGQERRQRCRRHLRRGQPEIHALNPDQVA